MELNSMFLIIFTTILAYVRGQNDYCYSDDKDPYLGFGTKSPYDMKTTKDTAVPSGCNVVYVYGIIRHGTRYPTESDKLKSDELTQLRDQIVSNHEKDKRGQLCTSDVEALKKWSYFWDQGNYGKLAPQGRTDIESLVDRIKSSMNDYSKNCGKDKLSLQTSSKNRCQESAIVFANRLLATTYSDMDGNNIKTNDDLLRDDEANKKSDETEKFISSTTMSNLITQVSERCGFNTKLRFDQILLLYKQCVFEKSIKLADKSPVCCVFTPYHLKTMEYVDDLDTCYQFGYGSSTYKEKGCPLVRDLHKKLGEIDSTSTPSQIGSFNFGHSSSILSFIAKLGFRKDDEVLKSDNFDKYKDSRKWKTSDMDNFGSNLYIIAYKCSGELKVSFYNNERFLRLQGADSDLVPYKTVKEKLEDAIKECPATPSGVSGFLFVREQLVLLICIVFGFLYKFGI